MSEELYILMVWLDIQFSIGCVHCTYVYLSIYIIYIVYVAYIHHFQNDEQQELITQFAIIFVHYFLQNVAQMRNKNF